MSASSPNSLSIKLVFVAFLMERWIGGFRGYLND
jgi:hypothetical protein